MGVFEDLLTELIFFFHCWATSVNKKDNNHDVFIVEEKVHNIKSYYDQKEIQGWEMKQKLC